MYDVRTYVHTYVRGQRIVNTSVHMPVCMWGMLVKSLSWTPLHLACTYVCTVHYVHARLYTLYYRGTYVCTYIRSSHFTPQYIRTYVCTYLYTATAGHPTPPTHCTDCTPHYCTSLIFPLSSTSIDLVSEKGSSKVGLGRERGRKFCSLRLVDRDMWTVRAFALPGDTRDGAVTVEATAAPLPIPPEGTDMLSSSLAMMYCC